MGAGPRIAQGERGHLVLDLRAGRPLIQAMGLSEPSANPMVPLLEGLDPVTYLLVGSRQAPAGRPPGMSVFNVFFDTPAEPAISDISRRSST